MLFGGAIWSNREHIGAGNIFENNLSALDF